MGSDGRSLLMRVLVVITLNKVGGLFPKENLEVHVFAGEVRPPGWAACRTNQYVGVAGLNCRRARSLERAPGRLIIITYRERECQSVSTGINIYIYIYTHILWG